MEKYLKPEMDIVEFETEDVITTSCRAECREYVIELPQMPL